MIPQRVRLPLLLSAIVTGISGCSFLPYKTPTAAADAPVGHPDEVLQPTDNTLPATASRTDDRAARIQLPPVCPPSDTGYRVRDLTHPWWDRVYLLPDGATCRPAGGDR